MGLPAIIADLHSSAVGKLQDRELQQEKKLLYFLPSLPSPWLSPASLCSLCSALAPRNEFLGTAGGCFRELPGKSVGWDLKHFLSGLWESFSAVRRNNPTSSYGSSESSYFYSSAWSRKGVWCLSCAVFIRAAGITFLSFLGNWTLRRNKPVHHLFPLLFSLCSPWPFPPPSPLFPSSLSCVCWEQAV